MTFQRQLVLLRAGDAPGLDHEFRTFAHRQAGSRLCDTGQDRAQIFRPQSEPRTRAFAERLASETPQQQLLKTLGVDHWGMAPGMDPRRERAVVLAESDLVAD